MSGPMADGKGGAVAQSATEDGAWRDKDKPPIFSDEAQGYKEFLRDLQIWRHETEIPVKKHGGK